MTAPAGWYPDPTSRFEVRYWSGAQWTEHVTTAGVQSTDALEPLPLLTVAEEDVKPRTGRRPVLAGFSWDGLTMVLTTDGKTDVNSWEDFDEALAIYGHQQEGLIGISWSSGLRMVRCYIVDGLYAVDVKRSREGIHFDVLAPNGRQIQFENRLIDEDIVPGWEPASVCTTVTPAHALLIARQWMETETVPAGHTLRAMATTKPYVELNLPTLEEMIAERRAEHEAEKRAERARALGLSSRWPRPEPLPFGVSDAGAEVLVRDWMRHLGAADAETTRTSKDGGIDVVSRRYVAQVKNYRGSVGAPEIRELYGVAQQDGRQPLFFTSGAFTAEAVRFADDVQMALLSYNAVDAALFAGNQRGAQILRVGL